MRYLKKNFDSLGILTAFGKVIADNFESLTIDDELVIEALRRSTSELNVASLEEISNYLSKYDESSIDGLVYNIRGILHEIEWVSMENSDGDSVVAGLFPNTNNRDYDIWCYDVQSKEYWVEQLKTTTSEHEVKMWMNKHPDEVIRVDEEMAEKLDISSTGLNREELEKRVRDEIDNLRDYADDDIIWDYFPFLTPISISLVVWELYKQLEKGDIDNDKFQYMVKKVTGLKLAKIAALMAMLSIPVINVLTATGMIYRLIKSSQRAYEQIVT